MILRQIQQLPVTNNKEYDENGGELTVYRIDKDIAEDDKRKRKKQ